MKIICNTTGWRHTVGVRVGDKDSDFKNRMHVHHECHNGYITSILHTTLQSPINCDCSLFYSMRNDGRTRSDISCSSGSGGSRSSDISDGFCSGSSGGAVSGTGRNRSKSGNGTGSGDNESCTRRGGATGCGSSQGCGARWRGYRQDVR